MALIIRSDSDALLQWAAAQYPQNSIDEHTRAIGIERDGEIQGVAFFNQFTDISCNIHLVTNGKRVWANREFLCEVFAYPFVRLGLKRLTAYVPAKNHAAINLDLRLGFQVEGRMIEANGDDDLIVLGMLRRNCIWIPEGYRHEQEKSI